MVAFPKRMSSSTRGRGREWESEDFNCKLRKSINGTIR